MYLCTDVYMANADDAQLVCASAHVANFSFLIVIHKLHYVVIVVVVVQWYMYALILHMYVLIKLYEML